MNATQPSSTLECPLPEFELLLNAQLPSMRLLALRYTRNLDRAEDLVQDAVVRALTFRTRFLAGSNFRAWISTVLTNTFLNRYRRQKREQEILGQASRFDVAQNLRSEETRRRTREPEKAITDASFGDDVKRALAALPEEFRRVVELCDVQALSYRDASATLGCPLGTVMSRLHRGRRLLQKDLETTAAERGIGPAGRRSRSVASAVVAPRRAVVALVEAL